QNLICASSRRSKKMNFRLLMFLSIVLTAAAGAFTRAPRPARAQAPASASTPALTLIAPPHLHHLHLHSLPPKSPPAYYRKPFPSTTARTNFNGYEAVKTGDIYLLFTKVDAPPIPELDAPQSSIWHFGWNTPDSQKYDRDFRAKGLEIAQMWDAADGKL